MQIAQLASGAQKEPTLPIHPARFVLWQATSATQVLKCESLAQQVKLSRQPLPAEHVPMVRSALATERSLAALIC